MPKLGCGNGRLDWESEVKPILVLKNEDKIILNYTKKAEPTTVESFDEL